MTTPAERLRRIEEKRDALLQDVEALPPEVLHAHPRPGKWSIHEIVEHLVMAEEDVLIDYQNLEGLEARPRSLKNHVMYVVVLFVLRFDIPVPVPSEAMLPTGDLSLGTLRQRWTAHHHSLRRYVGGLDRAQARRAVFRHPITGPLTVRQILRMLEVHLDRHIRQIRTLEEMQAEATADGAP